MLILAMIYRHIEDVLQYNSLRRTSPQSKLKSTPCLKLADTPPCTGKATWAIHKQGALTYIAGNHLPHCPSQRFFVCHRPNHPKEQSHSPASLLGQQKGNIPKPHHSMAWITDCWIHPSLYVRPLCTRTVPQSTQCASYLDQNCCNRS